MPNPVPVNFCGTCGTRATGPYCAVCGSAHTVNVPDPPTPPPVPPAVDPVLPAGEVAAATTAPPDPGFTPPVGDPSPTDEHPRHPGAESPSGFSNRQHLLAFTVVGIAVIAAGGALVWATNTANTPTVDAAPATAAAPVAEPSPTTGGTHSGQIRYAWTAPTSTNYSCGDPRTVQIGDGAGKKLTTVNMLPAASSWPNCFASGSMTLPDRDTYIAQMGRGAPQTKTRAEMVAQGWIWDLR